MERIPPKDRFSRHARASALPDGVLATAISLFGLDANSCVVTQLSGGFMNANFLVREREQAFVFRVYSTDSSTAQRECDLLEFLEPSKVRVPKFHALLEVHKRSIAVLSFIDGVNLEDRLLQGGSVPADLYRQVGAQLGLAHQIHFARGGFIGPGVRVGDEYETFAPFLKGFIDKTLVQIGDERLDERTRARLQRLVDDKWPLVLETEPRSQLVHCDFNPKNIMVSKGGEAQILATIDWEFCLSGNGLIDLGNFFRFPYDYGPDAEPAFIEGYRASGSLLPENWRDVAMLLDLGNMCSFLGRPENYPETFRTARAVISSTLARFGH